MNGEADYDEAVVAALMALGELTVRLHEEGDADGWGTLAWVCMFRGEAVYPLDPTDYWSQFVHFKHERGWADVAFCDLPPHVLAAIIRRLPEVER